MRREIHLRGHKMINAFKGKKANNAFLRKKTRDLTVMALPGILLLLVFNYFPMFGLILAFKDFRFDRGFLGSEWIGFENFSFFFKSMYAWRVTRNTIGHNLVFIVSTMVFTVLIALILYEVTQKVLIKFYQTTMFIPYFLSMSVVAFVGYAFFNADMGVLNRIIQAMGKEALLWYSQPKLWVFIMPVIYMWKNVGYFVLIYYAGLMGIDNSYYEAASIDGASKFQQIMYITLPLLSPVVIMMVILQVGRIFYSDFGQFYLVTRDSGALYSTVDVIDTYIYRALRVTGDIGVSAAVGFYQSVVGFILVIFTNLIVKKIDSGSAII
jgi:putative aldouronate transport system permease protein